MHNNRRNINDMDYVPNNMISQFINTDLSDPIQALKLMNDMDGMDEMDNTKNKCEGFTNEPSSREFVTRRYKYQEPSQRKHSSQEYITQKHSSQEYIAQKHSSQPTPTFVNLSVNDQLLKDTIVYNRRYITSIGGGNIAWDSKDKSISWDKPIQCVRLDKQGLYNIPATKIPIQLLNNRALIYKSKAQTNVSSNEYPEMIKLLKGDYVNNKNNDINELMGVNSPMGIYDARYVSDDITELKDVRGLSDRNVNITGSAKYNNNTNGLHMIAGNSDSNIVMKNIDPTKKYMFAAVSRKIVSSTVIGKTPMVYIPLRTVIANSEKINTEHFSSENQLSLTDLDNNINHLEIALKELRTSKQDIAEKYDILEKIIETEINKKKANVEIKSEYEDKYTEFINKRNDFLNKLQIQKNSVDDNIMALKQKYSKIIKSYEDAKTLIKSSDNKLDETRLKLEGLIMARQNISEKITTLKSELSSARDTRISLEDASSDSEEDGEDGDGESSAIEVNTDILNSSDNEEDDSSDDDDSSEKSDSDSEEIKKQENFSIRHAFIPKKYNVSRILHKETFNNADEDDITWSAHLNVMTGEDLLKIPIADMGISMFIIWDRELNDVEQEIVKNSLTQYLLSKKPIMDSISIPVVDKPKLFTVKIENIGKYYDNNSILLAVHLENRIKYLPENITFRVNQSNKYDSNDGNWEKRIVKPTIVMSKRTGKKWISTLNDKGEIILAEYTE